MKKQNTQTFCLQLLELKLKWGETIKTLNGDSTVLLFDSPHSLVMGQQLLYDSQAQYFFYALTIQTYFLFLIFSLSYLSFRILQRTSLCLFRRKGTPFP